jgi:molecular chaperone DnaK
LGEHKEKIDAATIADIEKAIEEAKTVDSTTSLEDVKAKSAALSAASMKIGEAMYKKTGSEGAAQPKADEEPNATEAEYTEKK